MNEWEGVCVPVYARSTELFVIVVVVVVVVVTVIVVVVVALNTIAVHLFAQVILVLYLMAMSI